ncbi:hypothetical protein F4777DRAFT_218751 [Nemania sp. FL0916]|nr:hypothetical protein F4777DRAFT_218751 [Nemania sp. FL0916]
MWARLFPPTLPTPLHTQDVRRKNAREQLFDDSEDDARPPPPKKQAHYSIHPIFEKYKQRQSRDDNIPINRPQGRHHNQASIPPVPESPTIEQLKRNYAALRVTLHSNGVKDVAKAEESLAIEAEKKINANLSQLDRIATRNRQLCASPLDCEVDTQITNRNGSQRTSTMLVRRALAKYQEAEGERSEKLARLWNSWEKIQAEIDEISTKLRLDFEHAPPKGTSETTSNFEWAEKEDLSVERQSKQVVDDMATCEEDFQEKLKDEEANILEAMLRCSLG